MMDILEYDALDAVRRTRFLAEISKCDWRAANFLHKLLRDGTLRGHCGENTRLFLLADGERLAAFCTLADRDEVDAPELTPWIGFVFTAPEYRGNRLSERLIRHACAVARAEGYKMVYISTDHIGLYEKYGFTPLRSTATVRGDETTVYARTLDDF